MVLFRVPNVYLKDINAQVKTRIKNLFCFWWERALPKNGTILFFLTEKSPSLSMPVRRRRRQVPAA